MPYSIKLEQKLDSLKSQFGRIDKKKMFGGIGYLLNGNIVFGIHKQTLIIRTSPVEQRKMLEREHVSVFNITGRTMKGWYMVSPAGQESEEDLLDFLQMGVDFVKTLPGK